MLARTGFAGGDPEKVLGMRVDVVVAAMQYSKFINEYERETIRLNSESR